MASKRTAARRDAEMKVIMGLIEKAKDVMIGNSRSSDAIDSDGATIGEITVLLQNVKLKKEVVVGLNEELINEISDDKFGEEIEKSSEMDLKIDSGIYAMEKYLSTTNKLKNEENIDEMKYDENEQNSNRSRGNNISIKLPQLSLKKFYGDPLLWPEFKEMFLATVDKNSSLTDIEKFSYLKGYVMGEAQRCIEGINLTSQNYTEALNILDERFGNKQLIISKHMEQLLKLESVKSSTNIRALRGLYDKITVHLRSLSSMNIDSQHFGPMLIPVVVEKLPNDIRLQMSRSMNKSEWNIKDVIDLLKDEIGARENCQVSRFGRNDDRDSNNHANGSRSNAFIDEDNFDEGNNFTTRSLFAGNNNNFDQGRGKLRCYFCQKGHFSDQCTVVTDVNSRKEIVKNRKLCFRCLKPQHLVKNCPSKKYCFSCKSRNHHTALCDSSQNINKNETNVMLQQSKQNSTLLSADKSSVLLQTVEAEISDVKEMKSVKIKVIFDSGSQRTYVTQRIADQLNLSPAGTQEMTIHAFGDQKGKHMIVPEYDFCLKGNTGECFYLRGFAVPSICAPIRDQRRDEVFKQFKLVQNLIPLSSMKGDETEIDILIGTDYYWAMMKEEIIRLNDRLVIMNSKLGYILSGPVNSRPGKHETAACCVHVMKVSTEPRVKDDMVFNEESSLDEKVDVFWNLDKIGILEDEKSIYHKCEEEIRLVKNRYEVSLPFKEFHPILEDNFNLSLRRLKSMRRRLELKPDVLKQYDAVISQQLNEGIIEKIGCDEKEPNIGEVVYLPHHAVIKENKTTTKLRVVMDASAKVRSSSLNECLYKGPCLTPLIFDSLLRFRLHKIAMTADIERAYLQISVIPEQRNFLRFLWYDDVFAENSKIEKYRFNRLIFGARPSQYLLNAVVNKHAEKYRECDPEFVKKVKKGFYVDDLNSGVESVEEGLTFYYKLKSRFADVNLHLRKWRTNHSSLREKIMENEGVSNEKVGGKILGLEWDEVEDTISINLEEFIPDDFSHCVTKRNVLKVIAGFFDPLGLIQPAVIQMKIIFQEVCCLHQDWDKEIPTDLRSKWLAILDAIRKMKFLQVPRIYCDTEINDPIEAVELHGFGDASLSAYGCCIYFKHVKKSGNVVVSLIASKSRVAPLKNKQTIPRLELLASLLTARLMVSVLNCFEGCLSISSIYCYTDSQVCLAWIKTLDKEFKTFVQNRLIEIRSKVGPDNWYYCPTKQNPADIITRVNISNLNSDMWIHGPSFLYDATSVILPNEIGNNNEDFEREIKTNSVDSVLMVEESRGNRNISVMFHLVKYRDVLKLFRVTCYVLRFISALKECVRKVGVRTPRATYCTADEMRVARIFWIKENQKVLRMARDFRQMKIQMNIIENEEGILLAKGRLQHSCIPYEMKTPIVLTKEHYLANLIVWYCHTKVLHNGAKQTITEIRSTYWIGKIRQFTKKLLHRCFVCRKLNSRPFSYPGHSDIPAFRFDDSRPFNSTGVDYLGPLMVLPVFTKPQDKLQKVHVVLYTCASSRAMVLDVVSTAEAQAFVQSFSRFISRRGAPNLMISDNGGVFKAAETQAFATNKAINWKFNLELAAWWGGMWERLVGMVKSCLKKTVGYKTLTYCELQTLILEIEVTLNNRPLCQPVEEDYDILTPNHLLFGSRIETMNQFNGIVDDDNDPEKMSKRQKHLRLVKEHFIKRWKREYITYLRDFHRSTAKTSGVINVGDVVLLHEEKLPRHRWNVCKIVEVITSRDGVIRGARVKIGKTGAIIGRPINKLYPLEVLADRSSKGLIDESGQMADSELNSEH